MKGHKSHAFTTHGLAFTESVSMTIDKGKYRWVYQPVARARTAKYMPWLDSFFSQLLQSYFHLGGASIGAAGISRTSANNMVLKDESAAANTINFRIFDENLQWTAERFSRLLFLLSKDEVEQVKEELAVVTKDLGKVLCRRVAQRQLVMEGVIPVADRFTTHQRYMEQAKDVKKAPKLLKQIEGLRLEMGKIRDGK